MQILIGEIIVLVIVLFAGIVIWKLFGKKKKSSIFDDSNMYCTNSRTYDDNATLVMSSWSVSLLNPKDGSILRTIPMSLSSNDEFTIGRDAACSLCLSDRTISGYHAYVTSSKDGSFTLYDNDSMNGIVVIEEGKEVKHDKLQLSDGLVCFIGSTPLGFSKTNSRREISFTGKHIYNKTNQNTCDNSTKKNFGSKRIHFNM